jgi:hypothetical protein
VLGFFLVIPVGRLAEDVQSLSAMVRDMHDTAQVLKLFGKDSRIHNVVLYNLETVNLSAPELKSVEQRGMTYEDFDGPCNHISSLCVDHGWYLPAGCVASRANNRSIEPFSFGWSTASLCLDPESKGRANAELRSYPCQIVSDA